MAENYWRKNLQNWLVEKCSSYDYDIQNIDNDDVNLKEMREYYQNCVSVPIGYLEEKCKEISLLLADWIEELQDEKNYSPIRSFDYVIRSKIEYGWCVYCYIYNVYSNKTDMEIKDWITIIRTDNEFPLIVYPYHIDWAMNFVNSIMTERQCYKSL